MSQPTKREAVMAVLREGFYETSLSEVLAELARRRVSVSRSYVAAVAKENGFTKPGKLLKKAVSTRAAALAPQHPTHGGSIVNEVLEMDGIEGRWISRGLLFYEDPLTPFHVDAWTMSNYAHLTPAERRMIAVSLMPQNAVNELELLSVCEAAHSDPLTLTRRGGEGIVSTAPVFLFPSKSETNQKTDLLLRWDLFCSETATPLAIRNIPNAPGEYRLAEIEYGKEYSQSYNDVYETLRARHPEFDECERGASFQIRKDTHTASVADLLGSDWESLPNYSLIGDNAASFTQTFLPGRNEEEYFVNTIMCGHISTRRNESVPITRVSVFTHQKHSSVPVIRALQQMKDRRLIQNEYARLVEGYPSL